MIIEPVPLGPPSALRRRLRALALVVPLVLLGGVVAAGTLGPQPAPSASPKGVAVASADTATADAATPTTPAPPSPGALPAGVPDRIAGLDVLTVAEAIEQRAAGDLAGVVAIAGHLGVRELPESCDGTFCARAGILAARPFTAATGFADLGVHLHPQLPAGVVLPAAANLAAGSAGGAEAGGADAPAAIVAARFDDPRARPCIPAGRHCGEELVVERVVWIDGDSYPRMLAVGPTAEPQPPARRLRSAGRAAERGLGAGATPLLTVLVRPGTIAYIDPAMAPILPDLDADAVWYARGLVLGEGQDEHRIAWVVAEADGTLIASGRLPVLPDVIPPGG